MGSLIVGSQSPVRMRASPCLDDEHDRPSQEPAIVRIHYFRSCLELLTARVLGTKTAEPLVLYFPHIGTAPSNAHKTTLKTHIHQPSNG